MERKAKTEERDFLLAAGSDDPSLGILHDLYDAQTQTASFFMTTIGSSAGLAAIRSGVADFATAHLWNPPAPEPTILPHRNCCHPILWLSSYFIVSWGCSAAGNPRALNRPRPGAPEATNHQSPAWLGNTDLPRSGAFAFPVEWQKDFGLRLHSFNSPRSGLEGFGRRCRRRLSHSDNGAVAGARFHSFHPRALRPIGSKGSILYARDPGATRDRRLARVSRACRFPWRVRRN